MVEEMDDYERKWSIFAKESKFIVIVDHHFLAFLSIILFLFSPSTTSILPTIYTPEKLSDTLLLLLLYLPPPHWPASNHPCHPSGVSSSFFPPELFSQQLDISPQFTLCLTFL